MNGFLFFSKVAFILNVLFFVALGFRYISVDLPQSAAAILVIGGLFLSLIVNLFINSWFVVLLIRKRIELKINSIFFINLVVLIIQLFIFFI
ncbi:hypothetical protein [Lacibacter sp.]|uniref:hypothetical protein n=1 Tax=Lacibacter sp. TaxID=1915409 RepID=UPI002B4B844D|nr:hypothetical protein [Lacibacter sp.]HLP35711.1 hypothetical protein [Lacibacter sp.]